MHKFDVTAGEFDLIMEALGYASSEAHSNAEVNRFENPEYADRLEARSTECDRLIEKLRSQRV